MILSTLSKTSLVLIVASLLLLLTQTAESHSWVQCLDWKFKKPQKKGQEDWSADAGECRGYARRFPKNEDSEKMFPKLDSHSPHRHFEQKHKNPESQPSCSNGKNGDSPGTYDETMAKPITAAYYGKERKTRDYGELTVKQAGDQMCIRWPAKNHAGDSSNKVYIALSGLNPTKDPSQKEYSSQGSYKGKMDLKKKNTLPYEGKTQRIVVLDYGNCSKGGSDSRPCGGCFNLPDNLKAGYYALQWRWELNDNEWYTSCADIKIVGSGNTTSTD